MGQNVPNRSGMPGGITGSASQTSGQFENSGGGNQFRSTGAGIDYPGPTKIQKQ